DSDGNLLKSEDKEEIKALAEEYQKRVENAYKSGGAEAVMTEMDAVKEDYEAYQESVAAAETEAEAESSAESEIVVEETAEVLNAPRILTAEEVSSPEEASETDTESETAEDTTEPETDAETSAETSAEEETAVASDEDADSETESSSEDASSEETADSDADALTSDETLEDNPEMLAEEETSAPYQNESIISVVHKEDYDNEEDIHYTPDETVYNKLLEITEADYGKVYFIEEDESYYLVVRYDITQRMTEDDLWTETTVSNAEYGKYYDAFESKMDEWASAFSVTRNEASFKRYDPYEYNF
ncbi:MAG: hypothetical protein IJJ69_00655, partial [Oscillospiraceae bacterium]|nr:hypothetical protein [Oscillospiraceae bacterium]